MDTYTFKLNYGPAFEAEVAVSGSVSLYSLAELLIDALGFDFDHSFGFYDNLKNPYRSKEKYTLFADMGQSEDGEPGVQKTPVSAVFQPRKKMLFLFDYGDEWRFPIACTEVRKASGNRKVRKVLSTTGAAPEQYPPCEDEE